MSNPVKQSSIITDVESRLDFISNTLIDLILGNPQMLIKNDLPYRSKSNNVFVKDSVKGKNYE